VLPLDDADQLDTAKPVTPDGKLAVVNRKPLRSAPAVHQSKPAENVRKPTLLAVVLKSG
jgi:hypothetical protein